MHFPDRLAQTGLPRLHLPSHRPRRPQPLAPPHPESLRADTADTTAPASPSSRRGRNQQPPPESPVPRAGLADASRLPLAARQLRPRGPRRRPATIRPRRLAHVLRTLPHATLLPAGPPGCSRPAAAMPQSPDYPGLRRPAAVLTPSGHVGPPTYRGRPAASVLRSRRSPPDCLGLPTSLL